MVNCQLSMADSCAQLFGNVDQTLSVILSKQRKRIILSYHGPTAHAKICPKKRGKKGGEPCPRSHVAQTWRDRLLSDSVKEGFLGEKNVQKLLKSCSLDQDPSWFIAQWHLYEGSYSLWGRWRMITDTIFWIKVLFYRFEKTILFNPKTGIRSFVQYLSELFSTLHALKNMILIVLMSQQFKRSNHCWCMKLIIGL